MSETATAGGSGVDVPMEAGRELDALVAEKVMGWGPIMPGAWQTPDGHLTVNLPRYSRDIVAAWQVVGAVQERHPGWRFCLLGGDRRHVTHYARGSTTVDYGASESYGWRAEFFGDADPREDYGQRHGVAHAPAAPLAICRAALAALAPPDPPSLPQ